MTEVQSPRCRPSFSTDALSESDCGRHPQRLIWFRITYKSPYDCDDDIYNFNEDLEDELEANGSSAVEIDKMGSTYDMLFKTRQSVKDVLEIVHDLADEHDIEMVAVKYFTPGVKQSSLLTKDNYMDALSSYMTYEGRGSVATRLKANIKVNRLSYKTESEIVHYGYKEKMFEVICEFVDILNHRVL